MIRNCFQYFENVSDRRFFRFVVVVAVAFVVVVVAVAFVVVVVAVAFVVVVVANV